MPNPTPARGLQSYSDHGTVRLLIVAFFVLTPVATDGAEPVDFNRDVLPILSDNCFTCHGPDENTREADLRLDTEDSVFADRDAATVVRGNAAASELIKRITSDDPDLEDTERLPCFATGTPPPASTKATAVETL